MFQGERGREKDGKEGKGGRKGEREGDRESAYDNMHGNNGHKLTLIFIQG